MTTDQIPQLKRMSVRDRFTRYTPLMLKGRISRQEYDWVFSLDPTVDPPPHLPAPDQVAELASPLGTDAEAHDKDPVAADHGDDAPALDPVEDAVGDYDIPF